MKGNEKDCICEKPKGKHTKRCDAFRLSEFFKSCVSFIGNMADELKTKVKVLTPDNEHVRQYLSDAKKGRKTKK